jgi:ribonuclease HII
MLCGVDEAGRGCWAGPVVAAAVVFRRGALDGLADSKALTAKKREALFPLIMEQAWCSVGMASAQEIDEVNILQATFLAMRRAVAGLQQLPGFPIADLTDIIVDGNQDPKLVDIPEGCTVNTLVKADALVLEVSAASIVAKVTRDRLMAEMDVRHPGYEFSRHAGYGVPVHLKALQLLGASPEHRMSFAPLKRLAIR